LIEALTTRLIGTSVVLSSVGARKEISGLGLSDWEGYAQMLESRFSYKNTFFKSDPALDITARPGTAQGQLDFLISSEVFDHVVGEVEQIFANVHSLLKPGGVLVFIRPGSTVLPGESAVRARTRWIHRRCSALRRQPGVRHLVEPAGFGPAQCEGGLMRRSIVDGRDAFLQSFANSRGI
jgi:predicted TPR repeat methyltransferase